MSLIDTPISVDSAIDAGLYKTPFYDDQKTSSTDSTDVINTPYVISNATDNNIVINEDVTFKVQGDEYTASQMKSMLKVLKELAEQKYPEDFV
jgi:hypothetical protein